MTSYFDLQNFFTPRFTVLPDRKQAVRLKAFLKASKGCEHRSLE